MQMHVLMADGAPRCVVIMTSICDITAVSFSRTSPCFYKMQQLSFLGLGVIRLIARPVYIPIFSSVFRPCNIRYQFPRVISTKTNMESNNQDLELSKLFDVKGKVALVTGGGIHH